MSETIYLKEHESLYKENSAGESIGFPELKGDNSDYQLFGDGLKLQNSDGKFLFEWTNKNKSQKKCYRASYIIGAQWVTLPSNNSVPVVIEPKLNDKNVKIDFMKMFSVCLNSNLEYERFSKIYGILIDETKINTTAFRSVLSPLIIVHFLSVVKQIVKKGLKKDYIQREENLNKVKGKICIFENERSNVKTKRFDRIYCRFQEYSVDTKENRLIKKALFFSKCILESSLKNRDYSKLDLTLKKCLSEFESVGDEITVSEIQNVKCNRLFKEYKDAIKLARLILRRYDFSLANLEAKEQNVPPFWIDMPLLYEHYVLGMLREAYPNEILYQEVTKFKWKPDFLHTGQKLILDTKYMPNLAYNNEGMGDIVRQLSGYARIESIRNKLGVADDSTVIPCVVIYPIEAETDEYENIFLKTNNIISKCERLSGVLKFYKIAVPLPKNLAL